jgi:NAD+ diphosphatase
VIYNQLILFSNVIQTLSSHVEVSQFEFKETRPAAFELKSNEDAAILAQAVSMVDWNRRNKFCAGCSNLNRKRHLNPFKQR